MVLLQSNDSPPGLSIESAREAGKGLPGVGHLTECADGALGGYRSSSGSSSPPLANSTYESLLSGGIILRPVQ